MSGLLAPALVLTRYDAHKALESLRQRDEEDEVADQLWRRIHRTWVTRGMNSVVVLHLSRPELALMRELGATTKPRVVECRYLAIYRQPDSNQEVRLKSPDKPPKRKTFRVPGQGRKQFRRIKLYRIRPKESIDSMARTRSKAKTEPEDIEELEGLEELEDLEGEEPDDDEEVEEAPKRKRRSRSAKTEDKPARKRRAKKTVEVEEEDDEEDEEDEDEEEQPKRRSRSKKQETTAKSSKGKSSAKSNGSAAGRTTKDLTGGVGTAELAEAASEAADLEITGRDVRVWLRKNEVEKDEESGRYTWPSENNKAFKTLAKKIAKDLAE